MRKIATNILHPYPIQEHSALSKLLGQRFLKTQGENVNSLSFTTSNAKITGLSN